MTTDIENQSKPASKMMEAMFKAGAHFAFTRSRRHPTTSPYIFGVKNKTEIFNLEKTEPLLEDAKALVKQLAKDGKVILFVGGKSEARSAVTLAGQALAMPFVSGRFIGGTISNFEEIRKRVQKFLDLQVAREKGELAKYTKKERLLIDRQIDKLDRLFSGIVPLMKAPDMLFIVDPRKEHNAVAEAAGAGIPIMALCGSDCNLKEITYPIVANDASVSSVDFILAEIIKAYKEGKEGK